MFAARIKEIVNILEKAKISGLIKDFCLIGGLAVAARGFVRATDDIDFAVSVSDSRTTELASLLKGDYRAGAHSDPLRGVFQIETPGSLPVQLIRFWDNVEQFIFPANSISFSGIQLPVASRAALTLLKLYSGSPTDLLDIEALKGEAGFTSEELELFKRAATTFTDPRIIDAISNLSK